MRREDIESMLVDEITDGDEDKLWDLIFQLSDYQLERFTGMKITYSNLEKNEEV